MKWIAVIVLWAANPVEWGIVSEDTQAKCQQVEQALRAKHSLEKQDCIEVSAEAFSIMNGKVNWMQASSNPIIGGFDCNRRRCRSFDQ